MALTVTPGDPDADAYASVEAVDAYHTARGNAAWEGTEAAKEAAIRRATAWIDGRYRQSFPGYRASGRLQALEWPRSDVTDPDGYGVAADAIPVEIVNATAEAALREIATPGSLSPDYVAAQAVKRETVGPLSVEYSDATGASSVRPTLSVVDGILGGLFRVGSGSTGFLVRA